jgi:hypothetical protein
MDQLKKAYFLPDKPEFMQILLSLLQLMLPLWEYISVNKEYSLHAGFQCDLLKHGKLLYSVIHPFWIIFSIHKHPHKLWYI